MRFFCVARPAAVARGTNLPLLEETPPLGVEGVAPGEPGEAGLGEAPDGEAGEGEAAEGEIAEPPVPGVDAGVG